MPVSLGQVYKAYVKNTGKMKDALILRKRGVNRKSAKVLERNKIFAEAKIATEARNRCLREPGCTYPGKDGKQHCKIECFVRYLREVAREKLST